MMNLASNTIEVAEQQCKTHGIRLTNKRIKLLSILLVSDKALSAYEIATFYKQFFDTSVPIITVYRVLNFFQGKGLVHRLDIANKYIACAHIGCHHTHVASQFLICNECQTVKELGMTERQFDELKQFVEQAGFYLQKPQIEVNCICENCHTET